MNYLITENQLKSILLEEKGSKITKEVESLNDFTKNILDKVGNMEKLNTKFFLTWGTAIGGMIRPLNEFIQSGNFELTPIETATILFGIAVVYFSQNENSIKAIINKIKEDGLYDVFKQVLSKAEELRKSFFKFLESLNMTLGTTVEMIHYAFLIPIIGDIQAIASESTDSWSAAVAISKRIVAAKSVAISGTVLIEVIKKIISKFS
jgi:hypothetical protein